MAVDVTNYPKSKIVDAIMDEDDVTIRSYAEMEFGSAAFDNGFADVTEASLRQWYQQFLWDMELDSQ